MRHEHIHLDFKGQFPAACLVYTGRQEIAFQHMLYRQYKGLENEITVMGPFLEAETSDLPIIRALINNLKKRDIPASGRLLSYAQDVHKMIDAYKPGEAYSASYYNRVLHLLYELCESMQVLRVHVLGALLDELEMLYQSRSNLAMKSCFNQEEIDTYYVELDDHLCGLRVYARELAALLKDESDNSHRIVLLTPVEEYLHNLVEMTEAVVYTTECTQLAMEEWVFCLEVRELQEMYN